MSVRSWFAERAPVPVESIKQAGNEPVPGHLKLWWFALGGTPGMLLVGQVITGLLLCVYYSPTPDHAWESVRDLMNRVPMGWWFRSLHKWGANLMIVALCLHLMRVFFTGAYRRPRELNWMVGVTLFALTLLTGFTGYSIVYEQLSFWGATVAANITEAVPLIGPGLSRTLRGGEAVGAATLSRFFILHAAVLPATILLLVFGHIVLVRLHGVSEAPEVPKAERRYFPFFPDHALTEVAVGLVLVTVATCLSVLSPAELGPRADPINTPEHIKPEWYFYFTFRWLKLTSLRAGIAGVGAALLLLYGWPFIDAAIRRRRPGSELSMLFGAAAIVVFLAFTVWEALS
jgi:ubiquinol-cytochrome c reductase cytochrome b subunit/cytochrome b6